MGMMMMNREYYEKLIQEDIDWLKTMPRTLERDHIIDVLEDSIDRIYGVVEFKEGDKVCYKLYPNICIGSVSSDINSINYPMDNNFLSHLIPIDLSDEWFYHFGNGVHTNSLMVKSDDLMLYTYKEK